MIVSHQDDQITAAIEAHRSERDGIAFPANSEKRSMHRSDHDHDLDMI